MAGCNSSTYSDGIPDPDKIVPKREVLIENLEDNGYTIEALTAVEDSDLIVDRIIAKNGNYVYCVSDKKTFKKAGFTSTGNVGVQYIHN